MNFGKLSIFLLLDSPTFRDALVRGLSYEDTLFYHEYAQEYRTKQEYDIYRPRPRPTPYGLIILKIHYLEIQTKLEIIERKA